MAYKVGTTIVIDDSGFVDWSRIASKPLIGAGTITSVAVDNGTPTAGAQVSGSASPSTAAGAYVGNCYVESLSGGGVAGDVTVTANRKYFNCNCNCRC